MVFLHHHRHGWHSLDMVPILHSLNYEAYEFASLNGVWNRGFPPSDFGALRAFWESAGMDSYLGPAPTDNNAVEFMCCAQFIVTRQRVRANPKEMYAQLYNWLRDSTAKNSDTSRWMEFVWHRLFGEEWVSSRPEPTVLCGEEEGASLCYNRDSSGSAKKFPFPQWHPTGATTGVA